MNTITYRNQYDEAAALTEQRRSDVQTVGESLTIQSGRDDADINVIWERMKLGQTNLPEPLSEAFYGDASNLPDLRAVLQYSRDAQDAFLALPARVRARFDNNAGKMWDFVHDPSNRPEAELLGILAPKPPTEAPPEGEPKPPTT